LVTCGYQRVHEKLKIFNRVFPKHFWTALVAAVVNSFRKITID
jgi:hypothetical protein